MAKLAHGWTVALAAAALLASAVPAADAARPNLATTKVSKPPATAVVGGSFLVKDSAKNKGSRRAGKTETRYYLSVDREIGLEDILMGGARKVPALERGERSAAPKKPRVMATVPIGTPAREYFLLGCADDRRKVRESDEGDNCRAAKPAVRVTEPLNAPLLRLETFSDTLVQPELETDEMFVPSWRPRLCDARLAKRFGGLNRALASAEKFLAATAGKDAMRAFAKSPDYRSAARAERAAAGAVLLGQPGAALAAMLRAHELERGETSHLVNAAALATSVGLPNEALAMLDAAIGRADADSPPMGISRTAVALTNRSQALASIGRWADAQELADSALAIEPLLAEAELNAGVADFCLGRGIARIRKARKRQPEKDPPVDDELGEESRMRNLPFPATPEQAVAIEPWYEEQSYRNEGAEHNRRRWEIQARIDARPRSNLLTERRRAQLLRAVYGAGDTPALQKLDAQIDELYEKSHDWSREKWCYGATCQDEEYGEIQASCDGAGDADAQYACVQAQCAPATKGWHQGWLADNTALYEKAQEWFRIYSRRASGIAAHIKDPETYALAMLAIEERETLLYDYALDPAWTWTFWMERAPECVEGSEPPPSTDGSAPTTAEGPGPCPPFVKGFNGVIYLGVVSFKVNCEEISVEGDLGKGWISGFGEVTYDYKNGKLTVVAGAKGAGGVPGIKGEFKSGIYVTATQQGFEDVGWRVGPGVTAGGGPVEFTAKDEIDLSFVGAFSGTDAY